MLKTLPHRAHIMYMSFIAHTRLVGTAMTCACTHGLGDAPLTHGCTLQIFMLEAELERIDGSAYVGKVVVERRR